MNQELSFEELNVSLDDGDPEVLSVALTGKSNMRYPGEFLRPWFDGLIARAAAGEQSSPATGPPPPGRNGSRPSRFGRLGWPAQTAQAAVFLASDESSFVTGIDLCVDGGVGQI